MKRGWMMAVLLASAAVVSGAPATVDPAYQKDFDKWKAELTDDMKQNWLPLAGLFWLKPGESGFGTDEKNPVALPAGTTQAQAGAFERSGNEVTLKLASGVKATIDGKPVTGATKLAADITGKPTVVEIGSLRMHVIQRGERVGIRVKDLNSAAVKSYAGPVFFPINMQYRVVAKWEPADGKKTVDVPNVLGDVTPVKPAGTAVFELNGQEFRLSDLGGSAEKGLFIVFNDLTSKGETYPAGRFLDTGPVQNGTVVLDFNRAYNPPCSVTPYATCPLPPKENRLPVTVRAGEKFSEHAR